MARARKLLISGFEVRFLGGAPTLARLLGPKRARRPFPFFFSGAAVLVPWSVYAALEAGIGVYAVAYEGLEEYGEAAAAWRRYLELRPGSPEAQSSLAWLLATELDAPGEPESLALAAMRGQ